MIFDSKRVTENFMMTSSIATTTIHFYNITQGDYEMNGNPSIEIGLEIGTASGSTLAANQQSQGIAALLVMLAVLCFIFAYCCWGAPFCRKLCKKYCCCHLEDTEINVGFSNNDQGMVATPTIILLPHGRMLVVDGTVFSQFQADSTGLDLVELGESVIRSSQRNLRSMTRHPLQSSQGSVLTTDGESPSKDSSWSLAGFPPPTYESIYGKEEGTVPPSYSDILLHRFTTLPYNVDMRNAYNGSKEEFEMHSIGSGSCPHIITNPINNSYAMANNFSGQSIACANLSRNPSLISNPLDGYYLNNEIGRLQIEHNGPHVNSHSHINISTISSLYNRANNNSREEFEFSRNETSETASISGANNSQNEIIITRNIVREEPQSNFKLEMDQSFRNSENERNQNDLEVTLNIRTTRKGNFISRTQSEIDLVDSQHTQEPSDFQVLPDIRESRV